MTARLVSTFLILTGLGLAASGARAQDVRTRQGPGAASGVHRDTLSGAQPYQLRPLVLPGSERIRVDAEPVDTSRYRLDYRYGRLWIDNAADTAVVVAEYRTLPFDLRDVYRMREIIDTVRTNEGTPGAQVDPAASLDPFAGSPLTHSGSITRGILAGNNRDVTVESGLRLQLAGEIARDVHVQAVLTDENTPILPEGTTQRLEEFDRVFIGIEAPYGEAQLGDFDLRFASSEFARFSRKLQGASFTADLADAGPPGLAQGSITVAGATSRGHFRSQEIQPIDGVQGPYRLEGSQGERFILVVPGSEIVYLDGVQLTRGESNHYTIDYATAEIHFTPSVIVTDDKRIRVEFQFTTNQFTRTLIGSQVETRFWQAADGGSRARFGAAFLREADSREFGEEFGFSREDSLALVRAGDGIARSGGAERVAYDPEATFVQYRREIRPLPDGGADTIFVAIEERPADTVAVYRVQFSRVGEGRGSYERVGRSVNGILYEYTGPGGGEYLPVRILPKPKQQRLVDLHGGLEPIEGVEVYGEWARTLYDANRMSPFDGGDDEGSAYIVGARLTEIKMGSARLSGDVRRRFTGSSFEAFDRIRPVEFDRRWNLLSRSFTATGGVAGGGDEVIDEGNLRLDLAEMTSVRAELGRLNLGSAFEGIRRAGYLESAEARLPILNYRIEHIDSRDALAGEDGRWLRQLGSVRIPTLGGRFAPRLEVEHERRRQRVIGTDSLARRSFAFVELRPGLSWESSRLEIDGFVELRDEDDWIDGEVDDAARSWTAQTSFRYRPSSTFDADGSLGYRLRTFTDRFRLEQQREDVEALILRWNTRYQPLQRALQLNWLYEGISERTPTLQEIYVRTGPEIGQYVWEDLNDDGVVQIDEFLPETLPNEGTYVKTFVPSDELIPVINVQTRLRLELDPARIWREANGRWQRRLSQVVSRTTIELREKTRDPNLAAVYLLDLSRFRRPGQTLTGRLRLAQDFFFFRNLSGYGLDVSFNQIRSFSELTAGAESRFVNVWRMEGRAQVAEVWSFRAVTGLEQDRLLSDQFATRTYNIHSVRFEPEVGFRATRRLQIVGTPAFARKNDRFADLVANVVKLPIELRYTVPGKLQATLRGEAARVGLDGEAFGLARFELTDGRGPGTSFLWSLRGQYTINEYLRATFSYDGRAPSDASVIHTMQLQLSALF